MWHFTQNGKSSHEVGQKEAKKSNTSKETEFTKNTGHITTRPKIAVAFFYLTILKDLNFIFKFWVIIEACFSFIKRWQLLNLKYAVTIRYISLDVITQSWLYCIYPVVWLIFSCLQPRSRPQTFPQFSSKMRCERVK